jgi:predicted transcriptional regulator
MSAVVRSASQCVVIGVELKRRLEQVARDESRDATNLARKVLTEYVTDKEKPK